MYAVAVTFHSAPLLRPLSFSAFYLSKNNDDLSELQERVRTEKMGSVSLCCSLERESERMRAALGPQAFDVLEQNPK